MIHSYEVQKQELIRMGKPEEAEGTGITLMHLS
jgi:hypothetical protein